MSETDRLCGTCIYWQKAERLRWNGLCKYRLIIPKAFYGLSYESQPMSEMSGFDCQAWPEKASTK